jgi:hypothetical protein
VGVRDPEDSAPRQLEPEDAAVSDDAAKEGKDRDHLRGPLESLFQEAIRRALSLGLGGFFLTEEAVRRAFSESVPQEWVDYLNRQSDEMRGELADRLVREFGAWLRTVDLADLLRGILEEYEFSAQVELSARGKEQDSPASLKVVRRRK